METLLQQLDYKLNTYEERLNLVKKIFNIKSINGVDFPDESWMKLFEPVFDGNVEMSQVKCILSKDSKLYSETKVAKILEIVSSYLINAPNIKKQEKENEPKIKIYHSKELFDRVNQEDKLRRGLQHTPEDKLNINVFVRQRNYKKDKSLKIKDSDIKKSERLSNYSLAMAYMEYKLKVLKNKTLEKNISTDEIKKRSLLIKQIGLMKNDMEDIYLSEHRPIVFKQPLRDKGYPDWEQFDILCKSHIKELLRLQKSDDINDDLNCLLLDLDITIKNISWTKQQKNIVKLLRAGENNKSIAEKLNVSQPAITKSINKIIDKILKYNTLMYTDWYYLNIVKGNYRKCRQCGNYRPTQLFDKETVTAKAKQSNGFIDYETDLACPVCGFCIIKGGTNEN